MEVGEAIAEAGEDLKAKEALFIERDDIFFPADDPGRVLWTSDGNGSWTRTAAAEEKEDFWEGPRLRAVTGAARAAPTGDAVETVADDEDDDEKDAEDALMVIITLSWVVPVEVGEARRA